MKIIKMGVLAAALTFLAAPGLAGGADYTYSGIPGKWQRGKGAKKTRSPGAPQQVAAQKSPDQEASKAEAPATVAVKKRAKK